MVEYIMHKYLVYACIVRNLACSKLGESKYLQ